MILNSNFFYPPGWIPFIPSLNEKPPTVYSLLQSIVNYEKTEKTKIKDLAKEGRKTFFDFDYPLYERITKEDFECMILNHFLMRRIGFETLTAFKIQLNVKLNEIMPLYNNLFQLIYDENGFGEITKKEGQDNRIINTTKNSESTNKTNSNNTTNSNTETEDNTEVANSDTPQNEIDNIYNRNYISGFNQTKSNAKSNDSSTQKGETNSNTNTKDTDNTKDDNTYKETISHINLVEVYTKLNSEIKNVYTLIFDDLECLFYQLI